MQYKSVCSADIVAVRNRQMLDNFYIHPAPNYDDYGFKLRNHHNALADAEAYTAIV